MSDDMKTNESGAPETPATAPAQGSSKTVKYIIIGLGALVVLGFGLQFLLGLLGYSAAKTMLKSEGIEVSGNPMSKEQTYTVKDGEGNTMTVGAGTSLPDDFPKDIPVYKGTILGNTSAEQDGAKQFSLSIETKDAYASVVGFYKKELSGNGWKITQEMTLSEGYTMFISEKGTLQLNVMVQKDDSKEETVIVMTTGVK